jgi:hypothetical protein
VTDIFAPPGGPALFAYTFCCAPCAAGDVAAAAGNNWCATCCVAPFCCFGCGWTVRCDDRKKLAAKHSITDDFSPLVTLGLICCCNCLLLTQELNQISHAALAADPKATVRGSVLRLPTQEVMMAAPSSAIASLFATFDTAKKVAEKPASATAAPTA